MKKNPKLKCLQKLYNSLTESMVKDIWTISNQLHRSQSKIGSKKYSSHMQSISDTISENVHITLLHLCRIRVLLLPLAKHKNSYLIQTDKLLLGI